MAEFCLDCFNQLHGTGYKARLVTLEDDFCEGCGTVKPCVVSLQPPSFFVRIIKVFHRPVNAAHQTICRRGSKYKIFRCGNLIAVERQTLEIQAAYIRVFGAAGAALDELETLPAGVGDPSIEKARRILRQAIEDTEECTELE